MNSLPSLHSQKTSLAALSMISRQKLLVGSAVASAVALTASLAWAELPKLAQKDTYKVGFAQVESNNPWRLAVTQKHDIEGLVMGVE
jgi:galactofuranose transport system substrate-binding protein